MELVARYYELPLKTLIEAVQNRKSGGFVVPVFAVVSLLVMMS